MPDQSRSQPFNALFYGGYETICTSIMRARGFSSKDELGTPTIFMAGGLAGCLGWSVIMPFDVAKTRLQSGAARGPLLQLMSRIIQEEGVRALFTGWSAAVWIDRSNQTIDAHVMTRVPLALWPTTRPPTLPPDPPITPHHPPSPPITPITPHPITPHPRCDTDTRKHASRLPCPGGPRLPCECRPLLGC